MKNATLLLTIAALAAGCTDAPTAPETHVVAGTYAAGDGTGLLRAETDQEVTDLLADGARVRLHLYADGTTGGELTLRADSGFITHDLTGSWLLDRDSVLLDHEADTFLRSLRLRYDDGHLSGAATASALNGWRVHVGLVRE